MGRKQASKSKIGHSPRRRGIAREVELAQAESLTRRIRRVPRREWLKRCTSSEFGAACDALFNVMVLGESKPVSAPLSIVDLIRPGLREVMAPTDSYGDQLTNQFEVVKCTPTRCIVRKHGTGPLRRVKWEDVQFTGQQIIDALKRLGSQRSARAGKRERSTKAA